MDCFLLGHQSGYTKYPCFLCLWDSRARQGYWLQKEWPIIEDIRVGDKNITNVPLVDWKNTVFPQIHIKLGLFKQLFKALYKEGNRF